MKVSFSRILLAGVSASAKYDAGLSDRYVSHTGSLQFRAEF